MGDGARTTVRSAGLGAGPGRGRAHAREQLADRALLAVAQRRVTPYLDELVDEYFEQAVGDSQVRDAVDRFTPVQFEHLKRSQSEHLRMLLEPDLTYEALIGRSREVGRIHSLVSVDVDWYVDAVSRHRVAVLDLIEDVAPTLDLRRVQTVVTNRFMSDLHGTLLGFRDVDDRMHEVVLRMHEVASDAHTVTDLARSVVETLAQLDGIAVALFARPDDHGDMQCECGSGPGFEDFLAIQRGPGYARITTSPGTPNGLGPMGKAWRTAETQFCHSWSVDAPMAPWRELARTLGWGGSASMPLTDRHGRSAAMLSLQSRWPGYFAAPARATMLEQVRRLVSGALVELEDRPLLSAVSGFQDRATHLALLARGEVEMHFQPVVSLLDGAPRRMEALARMRDGDRLMLPAEFLPAFGDDELFALFDLGLRQSFAALDSWDRAGLHTNVAVNLPVVAASDSRFVTLLAQLISGYAVDPGRLTLELLESGLAAETGQQQVLIEDLLRVGVRLAQDDLGAGHSSLLRLRNFPFDEVKIDQSLVRGTDLAPGAALHFIEPINDIAISLGLTVVIEGLESDGLIEAAVQLDVLEGQGFAIARPMPAAEVVAWARGYRLQTDPAHPVTALGALAGHVAWEHRVISLGRHLGARSVLNSSHCPLTGYLADRDGAVVRAHEEVHAQTLERRGSRPHRDAWARLVTLISAG